MARESKKPTQREREVRATERTSWAAWYVPLIRAVIAAATAIYVAHLAAATYSKDLDRPENPDAAVVELPIARIDSGISFQ